MVGDGVVVERKAVVSGFLFDDGALIEKCNRDAQQIVMQCPKRQTASVVPPDVRPVRCPRDFAMCKAQRPFSSTDTFIYARLCQICQSQV